MTLESILNLLKIGIMKSNTPNGSRYIGTTQSVHSSLAAQ